MGSEVPTSELTVVAVPEEALSLSRLEIMGKLVAKRELLAGGGGDRSEELARIKDELTPLVEDARKRRDEINVEVAKLKGQREMLHERRNAARQKFQAMIKSGRTDTQLVKKLDSLNSRLSDLDWDIQTTALTVEDESVGIKAARSVLEELDQVMGEMESLDQRNAEIEEATRTISSSIREAQEAHEMLLEKVKEGNKYHDLWKDYVQTLRKTDIELKEGGRRRAAHPKAVAYWRKRIEEEKKLEAHRQTTAALAAAEEKGPGSDQKPAAGEQIPRAEKEPDSSERKSEAQEPKPEDSEAKAESPEDEAQMTAAASATADEEQTTTAAASAEEE